MKTIKLPIEYSNKDDLNIVSEYTRLQNNVIRIAYNRFKDNYSEKKIRNYLKSMNLSSDLISIDSWFIQSAIYKAKEMFKKDSEFEKSNNFFPKRIFGSKSNLIKRSKNLIDKETYKNNRSLPLLIIGEAPKKGNRKFNFTNLSNIEFKPFLKCKISISLPKLRNNYKKDLNLLIKFSNSNEIPYQIQLSKHFIWITFDENKLQELEKEENKLSKSNFYIKNRYCGIDLNPNYIGFSVKDESDKIIHTEQIDLKNLTGKNINSNKLDHETKEIFHYIGKKLKSLKCEYVFLEDLNFKTGNKKKGKGFNRLTINQWNRNTPYNILSKYFKNKLFKVNAAYSSTIGNCLYNYSDPINASLEIGRRGFEVIILKKKDKKGVSSFYPEFNLSIMREEIRNQTAHLELNSWKELHTFLKNSKLKYRVSLDEASSLHPMFYRKFYSKKSKVIINYIKCNSFI
jgi:hypothetical protein